MKRTRPPDIGPEPLAGIPAAQAAITAFADALSDPRHAIAERMVHTTAIEALIPEIDAILDGRLDRLVEQLKGTPFYTEYHAARTIADD